MEYIAHALEQEQPPAGSGIYGRRNVITSSVHGDIVVGTSEGIKYGTVLHKKKFNAMGGLNQLDVESVMMNIAGDAVCIAGRDWVCVSFVPRRVDGVIPANVEWEQLILEQEAEIEACAWHAYADDHILVLNRQGILRLWTAAENGQLAAQVYLGPSGGHFLHGCFGSAWGWSRLAAFALVQGQLACVCPFTPIRAAAPTSAVHRMRTEALRLSDPVAQSFALEWLDNICPELAQVQDFLHVDNEEIGLEDHGFLTLRSDKKGMDEPQVVLVQESADIVAVANLDPEIIGSSAFLALAYADGRIELCLFQDLVLPRFVGRGILPRPKFCVLECLIVDSNIPENSISLTNVPENGGLLYTSSTTAAIVEVGWLEMLDQVLRKSGRISREFIDSDPATVRHLVKSSKEVSIVGTTIVRERGAATYLLSWFSDASAACVNLGAARLLLSETIDSSSYLNDVAHRDGALELPFLASDVANQLSQTRRELNKVPTVLVGSGTEHETTLTLQAAREALENKVALPLADAARCAQALTKLLKIARSAQAQAAKNLAESTKSVASRLDQLVALADACHDRGLNLSARARDLTDATSGLQPKFGKADRDFKNKVNDMDSQARRAQATVAQLEAKCAQIFALNQATTARPLHLGGHVKTISKALNNQAHLLAQLANTLNTLRTSLDSIMMKNNIDTSNSLLSGVQNRPSPMKRKSSSTFLLAPSSSSFTVEPPPAQSHRRLHFATTGTSGAE